MTDRQTAIVGLAYEVTVESNALQAVQSSLYLQLQHDYENAQNAVIGMSRDAYRLAEKYQRALNHYAAVGAPILGALAADAYTFYQVTSSWLSQRAASSVYVEAKGALDSYEGTDPAVLDALEGAADDALDAAADAAVDFIGAGFDAAAGGSSGGFFAAILAFFTD